MTQQICYVQLFVMTVKTTLNDIRLNLPICMYFVLEILICMPHSSSAQQGLLHDNKHCLQLLTILLKDDRLGDRHCDNIVRI